MLFLTITIWKSGTTEVKGTVILAGVINAFESGKDTAIVGGTGDFAGAQGVVTGNPADPAASVAKYILPSNL